MAKVTKKRKAQVDELARLWRSDDDVRLMVVATVRRFNVGDPTELATKHPKEFDALFLAATDLVEQAPVDDQWIPGMSS